MAENEGFSLIITVVAKGYSEDVIKAARECGVTGGTIVPARGTGVHEHASFFGITIEPEKDMVLTLVPNSNVDNALEGISKAVDIEQPNHGIAFVIDVSRVIGVAHALGACK